MDYIRFGPGAAIIQIEESLPDGSYRTIILSANFRATEAAWEAMQGEMPYADLMMRQGARIIMRRGPLKAGA